VAVPVSHQGSDSRFDNVFVSVMQFVLWAGNDGPVDSEANVVTSSFLSSTTWSLLGGCACVFLHCIMWF
jgi:hypothetical protein